MAETLTAPLYRWDRHGLIQGHVIAPGAFGQTLLGRNPWKVGPKIHQVEELLERVRCERFAAKPRRSESAFAWPSINAAEHFPWATPGHLSLYEVQLVRPDALSHWGDLCHLNHIGSGGDPEQEATAYWSEPPPSECPNYELVTLSPLRVVRLIRR